MLPVHSRGRARQISDRRAVSKHSFPTLTWSNMPGRTRESTEGLVSTAHELPQPKGTRTKPDSKTEVHTEEEPQMCRQPETDSISLDKLRLDVKSFYAKLTMLEAKCIAVNRRHLAASRASDRARRVVLGDDQWQSLTALHKQLLHVYYDFFLASQHPSSNPSLMGLAAEHNVAERLWRHGICIFLEVLEHRLPRSIDHMMTFVDIAYEIMALLQETVPAFQEIWHVCLGHLAMYRSYFENNQETLEVWISIAHFWYTTVSDDRPGVGYIYHHQAMLASTWLERLSLLKKSVVCSQIYPNGQSKIADLFMQVHKLQDLHKSSFEKAFLQGHRDLFLGSAYSTRTDLSIMRELLNDFIISQGTYFNRIGMYVAMTNITTVIGCKAFEACLDGLLQTNGTTAPSLKLTSQS